MNKVLRRYVQYLKLEKNYSNNTCDAYIADLNKFLDYINTVDLAVEEVRLEDMHNFSSVVMDLGVHPASLSRILSGVRSFYRFLLLSDMIDHDPM
jgi:integrase/recombinase XerD